MCLFHDVTLLWTEFFFSTLFVLLSRNERLFCESYSAYEQGRGGTEDPSEGWYDGELQFLDDVVIPLARKLADVSSSDECLTYALENRSLWSTKGHDVVHGYLCRYLKQHTSTGISD